LPAPFGPISAKISPAVHGQVDAAHGDHAAKAHGHPAQLEQRPTLGGRPLLAHCPASITSAATDGPGISAPMPAHTAGALGELGLRRREGQDPLRPQRHHQHQRRANASTR